MEVPQKTGPESFQVGVAHGLLLELDTKMIMIESSSFGGGQRMGGCAWGQSYFHDCPLNAHEGIWFTSEFFKPAKRSLKRATGRYLEKQAMRWPNPMLSLQPGCLF